MHKQNGDLYNSSLRVNFVIGMVVLVSTCHYVTTIVGVVKLILWITTCTDTS